MSLLTGIIKCRQCEKNYNYKLNNGTANYVCQTRKNRGASACDSIILNEQFLIDIIKKHIEHQGKDFAESKIKLFVREIKADSNEITIYYKDGTLSKISKNNITF